MSSGDPRKVFIDNIVKEAKSAIEELIEHIEIQGDAESKAKVVYLFQAKQAFAEFLGESK